MYEEIYYVAEGRGSTEVWQESNPNKKQVFEWSAGSLFGIPMNAMHRLVNATSSPALLLAATTAPNMVNLVRDPSFVLNNPYEFTNLFDAEDDYFKPVEDIHADPVRGLAMRRTNVIRTSSTATCRATTAARSATAVSSRTWPAPTST